MSTLEEWVFKPIVFWWCLLALSLIALSRFFLQGVCSTALLNSEEALELRTDLQALFQRLEIKPDDDGTAPPGTLRSRCVQCSNMFQPGYKFRRHVLGAHADAELTSRVELFMQGFTLVHSDGTYTCLPCGTVMKGSGNKDKLLHFVGKHLM